MFLRKLARAAAPLTFRNAFRDQSKSGSQSFGVPLGAIAAVSGGISYYFYSYSPNLVFLDSISEEVGPKVALNPEKWTEFVLQDKARVSHNTQLFRFSFDPKAKLGLDIASCLLTRAPAGQNDEGKTKYTIRPTQTKGKMAFSADLKWFGLDEVVEYFGCNGHVERETVKLEEVMVLGYEKSQAKGEVNHSFSVSSSAALLESPRYTPISDPDAKGYFDLLIKVYPEGKMSQHLSSLKPGDVVEVKGPIEKLRYTPNMKRNIGMIAGGSGITPMLQIIEAILKNPDDKTQVSLIYANVSPDDILLKEKLDILSTSHPNLKIFYTVDNPSKNWRGGAGFISKDMVVKGLPDPSEDTRILVCGPPGMMNHISGDKAKDRSQGELTGLLKELGYTEEMVYKF
ncbi:hypothetical protein GIB67_025407 [Kingdonia uniflora]|uniref:NADH-cytochrome b5 reductase n=1 Tax=Kingdonia uniflora TaxID=39325 RepID=A0A7J7NBF7_9MAGN|nr:hypothetical protein GIB67_025407 [Kingdonia uniflora]